ncbi:MAG: putative Ig domain-containing protein [Limisphaerales bacterium]
MAVLLGVCSFAVRTAAQDPRFRGASISWAPTANPDEVVFHITYAGRLSGSGAGVGATIPTADYFSLDAVNAPLFAHGLSVTVTAVSATDDWFVGTNDFVWSYATYGPAGTGPFTAGIFSSCPLSPSGSRISNLANRAGGPYIVQTQVTPLGANRSPVASFAPVVYVPESTHSTFLIPAMDPDGDRIRWRISTDAEAGGGSSPPNLSINPTNGVVTWNNMGLGYTNFTAQVIIEDLDAKGNLKTQCPVDFILTVVPNTAPTCQVTPGNPFTVALGSSVSFLVSAANTDLGDNVTLTASGLPAGASLTPALPLTNPTSAASTFFWAPQFADLGANTITFTATDSTGLQSTTNVTISVIVDPNQHTFIALPSPIVKESISPGGTLVPVTAYVTNDLGATLSVYWTVDGLPVQTDTLTGTPPTTNSASLTFSGNYGLGPHTVVVTASDGATPPATNTTFVTVVDTTPPVISSCPRLQTLLLDPVSKSVTIPDLRTNVVATDNGTATAHLMISQAPPPGTVVNKAGTLGVVFTVTDGSGNSSECQTTLAVVDTSAPQVYASLQVLSLWPPNHDLQCVGFSYVVSKPDAAVTIQVFSNEPDVPGSGGNALGGDDRFSPDATALQNGDVVLRSERVGNGPGRVYLIVATAIDSSGQKAWACKTVVVPQTPNAADVAAISVMADAAEAWFNSNPNHTPPVGYSQVGVGPVLGPKQTFDPCPVPPQ